MTYFLCEANVCENGIGFLLPIQYKMSTLLFVEYFPSVTCSSVK